MGCNHQRTVLRALYMRMVVTSQEILSAAATDQGSYRPLLRTKVHDCISTPTWLVQLAVSSLVRSTGLFAVEMQTRHFGSQSEPHHQVVAAAKVVIRPRKPNIMLPWAQGISLTNSHCGPSTSGPVLYRAVLLMCWTSC
jgi:hypothetical protein